MILGLDDQGHKKKIENSRINQFFKTSFTSILQTEKKTKHNGENH